MSEPMEKKTHQYDICTNEQADDYYRQATKWFYSSNAHLHWDGKTQATVLIAEFLANQDGRSLWAM